MKKSRFLLPVLLLFFSGLVGLAVAQGAKSLDGKKIFTAQNCQMCHDVSSAGIKATTKSERMKGPDLTGKLADKDADVMADILKKKKNTENGKPHPKAFTGSDEELKAMIAWLKDQKPTGGQ